MSRQLLISKCKPLLNQSLCCQLQSFHCRYQSSFINPQPNTESQSTFNPKSFKPSKNVPTNNTTKQQQNPKKKPRSGKMYKLSTETLFNFINDQKSQQPQQTETPQTNFQAQEVEPQQDKQEQEQVQAQQQQNQIQDFECELELDPRVTMDIPPVFSQKQTNHVTDILNIGEEADANEIRLPKYFAKQFRRARLLQKRLEMQRMDEENDNITSDNNNKDNDNTDNAILGQDYVNPERLQRLSANNTRERERDTLEIDYNTKFAKVAIIGMPNSGKSVLLNNLLNQPVSAVSSKLNTTREQTFGCMTVNNIQIEFIDTPGILPLIYENEDENDNESTSASTSVNGNDSDMNGDGLNDGVIHSSRVLATSYEDLMKTAAALAQESSSEDNINYTGDTLLGDGKLSLREQERRRKKKLLKHDQTDEQQGLLHYHAWQAVYNSDIVIMLIDPTRNSQKRDVAIIEQLNILKEKQNNEYYQSLDDKQYNHITNKLKRIKNNNNNNNNNDHNNNNSDESENELNIVSKLYQHKYGKLKENIDSNNDDDDISAKIEKMAKENKGHRIDKFILCVNKCDLYWPHDRLYNLLNYFNKVMQFDVNFLLSGKKKRRIDKLKGYLLTIVNNKQRYNNEWQYSRHSYTNMTKEEQILECIRGKIYQRTHQEVPYSVELVMESIIDPKSINSSLSPSSSSSSASASASSSSFSNRSDLNTFDAETVKRKRLLDSSKREAVKSGIWKNVNKNENDLFGGYKDGDEMNIGKGRNNNNNNGYKNDRLNVNVIAYVKKRSHQTLLNGSAMVYIKRSATRDLETRFGRQIDLNIKVRLR